MKYINATTVWDREDFNLDPIVNKIFEYIYSSNFNKKPIRILVPGVGKGRMVRDLLKIFVNKQQQFELIVVEPNGSDLQTFIEFVETKLEGKKLTVQV